MNWRHLLATAKRVLLQLSHDRRSVAMIILIPILLETLLWLIYRDNKQLFNQVGASLLGIFPLVIMFIIASVTTLRERTRGTLERVLAMPLNKAEFVLGYALAFTVVAIIQSVLVSVVTLWLLGLNLAGSDLLVILVAVLDGLLGMALGLFVSAYAANEFQAVQFMPAVILPQLLLSGLLVPREQMYAALHWISEVLPMSYAVDAMRAITISPSTAGTTFWPSVIIIVGFVIGCLLLGAASLRRKTA